MTDSLPAPFATRMQALLGAEAAAFFASLSQPPSVGLRVNTLKTTPEDFQAMSPFPLEAVPWCPEGFVVTQADAARPGRHPYHAAGLYYLQDPSAMAATVLLDPRPGETVLDLCGAPGGKATHIAARLQHAGLLVANDVVRRRTAALVENLERFGAKRSLVTSAPTSTLAEVWPAGFDRVLVDAPCSGEGLFRKRPAARQEWTPAVVEGCAARQRSILDAAARLVRPGGRLVYATCTFAPEENEAVVAHFLRERPDFTLVPPPPDPGFSAGAGRPDWIRPDLARGLPLERCLRLWPHRAAGEGHFLAVLQREGDSARITWPAAANELTPTDTSLVRAFWRETLACSLPAEGLSRLGQGLYQLPAEPKQWQPPRPVRAGWHLGQFATKRFTPAHALAQALNAPDARQTIDLAAGSSTASAYLRGETLRSPGPDGWLLVTVDGFPLGWGKRVQNVVKNHYPRRLRRQF